MTRGSAKQAGFATAIVLTFATIALWGFAHRLYATLLPGLGATLALTPSQTEVARTAVGIGYFLMGLPAAFITRNFGYKLAMLFGIGVFAVGIFLIYPAVTAHSMVLFIAAATVIGSGLAAVEVSAMPLVVFLGSRDAAIQRTILAAALSPIGALAALFIGMKGLAGAEIGSGADLVSLLSTLGGVAIALAFIMEMVHFPSAATVRVAQDDRTLTSFLPPLRIKRFRYAVVACFLCLFAQIIIAGFGASYAQTVMPSWPLAKVHHVMFWAYLALVIGRFIGPLLMYRIAPMRLLVIFSAASTLCAVLSAVSTGTFAMACLIGMCFFMSILFPTIFADALRDLGDMAKSAAAVLLFVAFTGTGIFDLLAIVNTPQTVRLIMVLPALCFAVITLLAFSLANSDGRHATESARRLATG